MMSVFPSSACFSTASVFGGLRFLRLDQETASRKKDLRFFGPSFLGKAVWTASQGKEWSTKSELILSLNKLILSLSKLILSLS